MPATAADIARAMRRAIIVEVENPATKAAYPQARDGRSAPAPGYYDAEADAQAAMEDRAALTGVARRRYGVSVADLLFPDLSGGVPVWTLIDAEQDVDGRVLTARIELDAETETTTMELYG